jgi:hypothetical protein
MMILFWVVLLVFSIVRTKIVHYSSLCYFPLSFLAAASFYDLVHQKRRWPSWNLWLQLATGCALGIAMASLAFMDRFKPWLLRSGLVRDQFARASLQAEVHWNYVEALPGLLLLTGSVIFFIEARRNIRSSLLILFCTSLIAVNLAILILVPKVEPYSQGAAIEFYMQKQNEMAIIKPLQFKSYAQLFYARRKQELGKQMEDYIIKNRNHPEIAFYYVGKIQHEGQDLNSDLHLSKLYEKNGFVFYKWNR